MIKTRSPKLIPVLLVFPEHSARLESWGHLTELSALGAKLSTRIELQKTERLFLSFALDGEEFKGLQAEVNYVERDIYCYAQAELRFIDEVEKHRLSKTLLDVLSRSES